MGSGASNLSVTGQIGQGPVGSGESKSNGLPRMELRPTLGAVNSPSPRAVVVGAGVFGLSAAVELRSRGWRVTVLDPGPVPHPDAASTDISKLIRMDYGADRFFGRLAQVAMEGWDRWNAEWSWQPFHPTGFLILAGEPMAPGGYEYENLALLRELDAPVQAWDGADVSDVYPAWTAGRYPDAYVSLRAGWAESGRVCAELAALGRARGVTFLTGTADGLMEKGSRVVGVRLLEGQALAAERVVVSAGSWTPSLLPDMGDVMWATGQPVFHLRVEEPEAWRPPAFLPFCADIARSGWYGFPAQPDGTLKVAHHGRGRPFQPGDSRVAAPEQITLLREFLRHSLPDLVEAPVVATRTCVYCDTFDGDFWIAQHPDRPGLVVASGGSGHGFKFAPVLGPIIADVVEEEENPWADRFGWRDRGPIQTEWARSDAES